MQGSRSDTRQLPTVMCRCGSRPTVDAERPCTQMELVDGCERFMVSGPMGLEDLKQTDGHRISALRRPSYGIGPSGLLLEGVLHLLASIFQTGLRLVQLPLVLGAVVTGELAGGFLSLAAHVVDLVAQFVFGAHALPLPFRVTCGRCIVACGGYPTTSCSNFAKTGTSVP